MSAGNSSDVLTDRLEIGKAIQTLVAGTTILRLVDRDARSPQEVTDAVTVGVRVLARRHLESYLLDPELLTALAAREGAPHLAPQLIQAYHTALNNGVGRGNAQDDIKSAAGEIYTETKRILGLTASGNTTEAFLRDTMAPLLAATTNTYAELRRDIFGP